MRTVPRGRREWARARATARRRDATRRVVRATRAWTMENTTTPSTAVAIVGARGRGKTTVCNGLIRETMARLGRDDDDGAREARGGLAAPVREVRA